MRSSGRESSSRRIGRVILAISFLAVGRSSEARITRVEFTTVQSPASGGTSFDAVGPYEKLAGRAFGEIDPSDPHNGPITDLILAPRNTEGKVEYSMDVYLLKRDASGEQIPFLRTKAERLAAGDPRPSLAERYGTHARYVKKLGRAAKRLRRQRLLLPEDAVTLTTAADATAVP